MNNICPNTGQICPFLDNLHVIPTTDSEIDENSLGGYSVENAFKILDHISFIQGMQSWLYRWRAKSSKSDCMGGCALQLSESDQA